MNPHSRCVLLLLLILPLSWSIAAQTGKGEITPEETAEVNAVAHRFADRMFETKDIRPLLPKFFARDFIKRSLSNTEDDWLRTVDRKVARQMPKPVLKRWFIASNNWVYVFELYLFSIGSAMDNQAEAKLEKNADYRRLLNWTKRDPIIRSMVLASEDDPYGDIPITRKRFLSILNSLERFEPVLRRHAIRTKAGTTPEWNETMDYWQSRFEYYQPRSMYFDGLRYSTPPNTRLFSVTVPCFQLVLVKFGGKMKIVDAFAHID